MRKKKASIPSKTSKCRLPGNDRTNEKASQCSRAYHNASTSLPYTAKSSLNLIPTLVICNTAQDNNLSYPIPQVAQRLAKYHSFIQHKRTLYQIKSIIIIKRRRKPIAFNSPLTSKLITPSIPIPKKEKKKKNKRKEE